MEKHCKMFLYRNALKINENRIIRVIVCVNITGKISC